MTTGLLPTGGLALWLGDKNTLNFLFANQLLFQPANNAGQ